jgi:hypothetical protein
MEQGYGCDVTSVASDSLWPLCLKTTDPASLTELLGQLCGERLTQNYEDGQIEELGQNT